MLEINDRKWRIIGTSVRGANHVRQGMPNQDAIRWRPAGDGEEEYRTEVPLVISLADGHGSEKYFRSECGARFAVAVANEVLYQFGQGMAHASFSQIEVDADHLPHHILTQWKQCVEVDWETYQQDKKAREWLESHVDARKAIEADPTIYYGTTLISVLITERFILYCQVGDGDILTVTSDGTYTEPVPADKRNFANETISLCNATAGDFRIQVHELGANKPSLIMLATDGYTDSFLERHGFYKVATDIWHIIHTQGEEGLRMVANDLEGWLERSSQLGSGDDISAGILWRMSAFQEQAPAAEAGLPTMEIPPTPTIQGVALSNIDDDEPTYSDPTPRADS